MNEEISDSRLHTFLRKWINENAPEYRLSLASIYFCGISPLNMPGIKQGVYVLASEKESKTFGTTSCRSSWSCPKCTARKMTMYGERIACAIDSFAHQNQSAMMFTMTIPHLPFMSCAETYEVLMKAYRHFQKDTGNGKKKKTFKKADGTISEYNVSRNPFNKFRTELNIVHSVRVYEMTHGENSWHPHIHGLLWTSNDNWDKIAPLEESVFEYWWKCCKDEAIKFWTKKRPEQPEENQKLIEDLFSDWRKYPKTGHRSFYLSKNEDGSIRKAKSSYYITGWSSNLEMTGLSRKEGRNGHKTPYQIIHNAYFEKDKEKQNELVKLYLEYASATKGHCRVYFSKGLNQIINNWKKTEIYHKQQKKKSMEKGEVPKLRLVDWFSKEQWSFLSYLDATSNNDEAIIDNILETARAPDIEQAREMIALYCLSKGVDIYDNPLPSLNQTMIIENFINRTA